jgi:hypothetical protein
LELKESLIQIICSAKRRMSSCSENPFDSNCICSSTVGSDGKVYDPATQTFHCCGHVPFNITGTNLPTYIDSIPEAATPYCSAWWDQYRTAGSAPYGEKAKLATILSRQEHISSVFTPAVVDTAAKTITCATGTVPRWASFKNPNKGEATIPMLVCTSIAPELASNVDFIASGASTYKIKTCTNSTANVCAFTGSGKVEAFTDSVDVLDAGTTSILPAVMPVRAQTSLAQDKPAAKFKDLLRLTSPFTGQTLSKSTTTIVAVVVSIIILLIIGYAVYYYMRQKKKLVAVAEPNSGYPPQFQSNPNGMLGQPPHDPYGQQGYPPQFQQVSSSNTSW